MFSRVGIGTLALIALAGCHRRAIEHLDRCAPGATETTMTPAPATEPTSTTTVTQAEVTLEPQPAPVVPVQPAEPIAKVPPPPPPANASPGNLSIISGGDYAQNMGIADGGPNAGPPPASQEPPGPSTFVYESVIPYPPKAARRPGPPSAADRNTWAGGDR